MRPKSLNEETPMPKGPQGQKRPADTFKPR